MKAKLVGLKRKAEDSPQNAAKKKKLGLKVASAPAIVNGSTSASAKSSPPASSSSTQIVEKVKYFFFAAQHFNILFYLNIKS